MRDLLSASHTLNWWSETRAHPTWLTHHQCPRADSPCKRRMSQRVVNAGRAQRVADDMEDPKHEGSTTYFAECTIGGKCWTPGSVSWPCHSFCRWNAWQDRETDQEGPRKLLLCPPWRVCWRKLTRNRFQALHWRNWLS